MAVLYSKKDQTRTITVGTGVPVHAAVAGDEYTDVSNGYQYIYTTAWTRLASTADSQAYADSLLTGLWDDRGNFDASVNAYPTSGGSGTADTILKGDIWTVSVAGTLPTGQVVEPGDTVRALTDSPGNTQDNWAIAQNNIGYTPENVANKDTDETLSANSDTNYPSQKAVKTYVDTKQDTLVSGSNIKTIGGISLLGSGDVPTTPLHIGETIQNSTPGEVLFVGAANDLQGNINKLSFVGDKLGINTATPFYTVDAQRNQIAPPNSVINTIPVTNAPYFIAITPDGLHAYVTNFTGHSVSIIDTTTKSVIGSPITVGNNPAGVAISPDGSHVYVANIYSNNVSVIATSSNTVVATVSVGNNPLSLAVTPDGSRVYVTNQGNNVSVIDTSSNTVIHTTNCSGPTFLAITPDGSKVYVGNALDKVFVINTSTNNVVATITVVGGGQTQLAITPNGNYVYVVDGGGSSVSVISTATNTVTATISTEDQGSGIAISPDGLYAYVNSASNHNVQIIQISTNTIYGSYIDVGNQPFGIAITANGKEAYVVNQGDNTVSVITLIGVTGPGSVNTTDGYYQNGLPLAVVNSEHQLHLYNGNGKQYTFKDRNGIIADDTDLAAKQDTLISGTNIKTINGTSLLGSGNIPLVFSNGANILYVSPGGSDTDTTRPGHLGNPTNPFLTLEAAAAAAISGDLIYVFNGSYTVTTTATNGIAKDGVNYYFEAGCIVTKATTGAIFDTLGFTSGINVHGYASFYKITNGGYVLHNEINNLSLAFHANIISSTTDVCLLVGGTSDTVITANHIKSTASVAIQTPNTFNNAGSLIVNVGAIESTVTYAVLLNNNNSGRLVFNCSKIIGVGATYYAVSYAGFCDVTYNCPYISGINGYFGRTTCNGYIDRVTMPAGTGTFIGGRVGYINMSGGYAECEVYDPTNSAGLTQITVSGGLLKVKLIGARESIGMNITGGKVYMSGDLSFGEIWGSTNRIINGGEVYIDSDVRLVGTFYDTFYMFKLLSGKLFLRSRLYNQASSDGTGVGVIYSGGNLIIDRGSIITSNTQAMPIQAINPGLSLKVLSGGFSTNRTENGGTLAPKKQKHKYTLNSVIATTIILNDGSGGNETFTESNTTTYNTTALLAQRMVTLINASGTMDITATQDTPGTDVYFYIESDVAGIPFTVPSTTNLTLLILRYNSYLMTEIVGGTILENANVE